VKKSQTATVPVGHVAVKTCSNAVPPEVPASMGAPAPCPSSDHSIRRQPVLHGSSVQAPPISAPFVAGSPAPHDEHAPPAQRARTQFFTTFVGSGIVSQAPESPAEPPVSAPDPPVSDPSFCALAASKPSPTPGLAPVAGNPPEPEAMEPPVAEATEPSEPDTPPSDAFTTHPQKPSIPDTASSASALVFDMLSTYRWPRSRDPITRSIPWLPSDRSHARRVRTARIASNEASRDAARLVVMAQPFEGPNAEYRGLCRERPPRKRGIVAIEEPERLVRASSSEQ
jgi:hypothetical protein